MKKILILGNRGMMGHILEMYLKEQGYQVIGLNRTDLDMVNYFKLNLILKSLLNNFDIIINCIGILKPNSKDRFENAKINIGLPLVLSDFCKNNHKNLIHLSTNCVYFDIGPHEAEEEPTAKDLYGLSKAFGEIKDNFNLTIRTSIIGPELKRGSGLFDWFVNQSSGEVIGYTKTFWNGCTTLQLSKFINECIEKEICGIINYYTNITINKAELLHLINQEYNLNKTITYVEKEAHSSLLSGPYFTEKSISKQLEELRDWYGK